MKLSKLLNRKIELYHMVDEINEINETTRIPVKLKDVWCKIIPNHGTSSIYGGTHNVEEVKAKITIITRKLSIKNPKIDMYFLDSNGIRYNIIDFFPNYLKNDYWDFNCEVVYE